MRTTVDLSADLYRRAKAVAAMRGRKFKDLIEEALRQLLATSKPDGAEASPPQPSLHDLMQDCCGMVTDVPAAYATNPKHMEGFGR
ncbi:MAG TPA: ribbon-helix-helix domain-containing protein [Stellaceae bacterium]|jgi:hypothetical protein